MTIETDWMTVWQAAAHLGISPLTLRNWSDNGTIPHYRTPGGHRRYRRSELENYIERWLRKARPVALI